jgi:hypothetical protein
LPHAARLQWSNGSLIPHRSLRYQLCSNARRRPHPHRPRLPMVSHQWRSQPHILGRLLLPSSSFNLPFPPLLLPSV